MTRSDRRILWVGSVVLLLLAGWVATRAILSLDAPPPDDADLSPQRREVSEDRNAFALFKQAAEKVDLTPEARDDLHDFLDGRWYDAAEAHDLLERNAEALAVWRQGLARPALQVPCADDTDSIFGYWCPPFTIVRLADLRALSLFRQGMHGEAFHEAMWVIRFGRMVMGAGGDLGTFGAGVWIEETGLARLRRMLPQASLDKGHLALLAGELAPRSPRGADLAKAFQLEYQSHTQIIEDFQSGQELSFGGSPRSGRHGRPLSPFILQVNRTKGMLAGVMRPCVENAAKPYAQMVWPERPEGIRNSVSWLLWTCISRNGIGKMLLSILASSDSDRQCLERKCTRDVSVAATRLLLALKGYKMDKGRLPETLGKLVPAYIEAVPLDDFDGRPFRYSARRKVIYSVAKNLTDDGGAGPAYDEIDELAEEHAETPPEVRDLVFPICF